MTVPDEINEAYLNLVQDKRITVWHISMYTAVLSIYLNNGFNPIPVTRRTLMQLTHIRSIVTYHKCLKELQEWGYIHYVPSYNGYFKSRVFLIFNH